MKLKFDVTLDDVVDANVRLAARSKVASGWQRQGVIITALLGAVVSGGLIFALFTFLLNGVTVFAVIGGIVAAVLSAALAPAEHRKTIEKRYRKFFREQFGSADSVPFELDLTDHGIWTSMAGTQQMHEWSNIDEVEQTPDSIIFYTRNGGGVFVRKRAFDSPQAQHDFINTAEGYIAASRPAANWRLDD